MADYSNIEIVPLNGDMVITLQEAKDYLDVDFPVKDDDITLYILTATQALQDFTGLAFLPSTVTLYVNMEGSKYFLLPYSNKAVGDNIKGNRWYTDEDGEYTYQCGETKDWMKLAVKKYVADSFIHRGEEGYKVGIEAKSLCAPFISHGGFF